MVSTQRLDRYDPGMSLFDVQGSFEGAELSEATVSPDPVAQFRAWMDDALRPGITEPTAMTLATMDASGRPTARTVLLKEFDDRGFVFYTNYESRKAAELARNPNAVLLFYWADLLRQVRIEGLVTRVSRAETEAYFRTRPRDSQLGAWASPQSEVVADRDDLLARYRKMEERFGNDAIPAPPHWGGYRLEPDLFEFWQGRPSRLHDRLRYIRGDDGTWRIERLAP